MRLDSIGVRTLRLGALALCFIQAAVAFPLDVNETYEYDELPVYKHSVEKRADARDFYLRIMPVGASIVKGWPIKDSDPTGNGFRKYVRDQLRFDKWKVNMVGSQNHGSMADNDVEAIEGDRIDQVHARIKTSVPIWQPNLYLINAGTNDAVQRRVEGAGERMRAMLETIFADTPDATVILSTLIQSADRRGDDNSEVQPEVLEINKQLRTLAAEEMGNDETKPRHKVYLAEMQDGFITSPGDYKDATHPNAQGYKKMAAVWMHAINKVNDLGWLKAPNGGVKFPDGESHSTCRKVPGSGGSNPHGAGVEILFAGDATIRDDGLYTHQSKSRGQYWSGDSRVVWNIFWAQLVDFGAPREEALDELIIVNEDTDDMKVYVNRGDGNHDSAVKFSVGHFCITRGIHWGDVNGDGLDDYICIAPDGTPFVAINTSKQGQVVPSFGAFFKWRDPISGYAQDRVRLGDIDGDGRLDYCVMHDNADIYCYRNGGLGDGAAYWQDMGQGGPVFTGKGMGDMRGVRFVDINGDGRSDWVWIGTKGETTIYINKRGVGTGMVPYWEKAAASHPGMGEDTGETRYNVQFGRIYGNGFRDYSWFKKSECKPICKAEVLTWENRAMDGHGGRWQKGDGANWGDMTGSGFDDYVWISAFGQVNVFPNKNTKASFDWYKSIAWGAVHKFETGFSRRALHIGDWDGDGKADIIAVDRASGMLTVWYSRWDGTSFNFKKEVQTATAGRCNLGWGVLYHDTAHHFADITGNGKVDYICVHRDGYMQATLNLNSNQLSYVGQIKYGENLDRANYKFADVNGDGLADILHVDKFTGAARVWYNQGPARTPAENSGSAWKWERPTAAYTGTSRGPNMHYPSLTGQGRADMVEVNPNTAHGWVSFNTCEGGGGDDDDTGTDPGLPGYKPGEPGEGEEPGEHWFCDKNPGLWKPQMWTDYSMGGWLQDRTAYYSGQDRDWPDAGPSDGVPRVIAEYDYEVHDNAFNWPGPGCQSIRSNCNLNQADLKVPSCRDNWRRAFSLWSMRNLVLYMQAYHDSILESAVYASFDTSLLATNFLAIDDPPMNPSAWLTIVSGMVTSFAAVIPGAGQVVGNGLAGLLTAAAGIAAGVETSVPQDPRFDKFSELEQKLKDILTAAHKSTENYFHRLIIERPPNHDLARGTELATILETGVMADQDFGTGETSIDQDAQKRLIRAPLLSEIWNGQDVVVVKFGRSQIYYDKNGFGGPWTYSPCFGDNNVEELHRHNACPEDDNNNNYMIVRWSDAPGKMFDEKIGTAKDTLGKLDLTKELIVKRAQSIQERFGVWRPRDMDHIQQNLKDLASNNKAEPDDALWVNLPVCDLTKINGPLDYGDASDYCYESPNTGPEWTPLCLHVVIRKNCPRVQLQGQDWPLD